MKSCVRWGLVLVLFVALPRLAMAHEPLDADSPVIGCDEPIWAPFCEARYSPTTRALWVCFACGCEYVYLNVPPDCFRKFGNSAQKGAFFNRRIRPVFCGRRLLREERTAMARNGRALCKIARISAARAKEAKK